MLKRIEYRVVLIMLICLLITGLFGFFGIFYLSQKHEKMRSTEERHGLARVLQTHQSQMISYIQKNDAMAIYNLLEESNKKAKKFEVESVKFISVFMLAFLILFLVLFSSILGYEIFQPLKTLVMASHPKFGISKLVNLNFSTEELEGLKNLLIRYEVLHQQKFKDEEIKSNLKARVSIARQVSHDIRSPLSALNMITGSLHELGEEKRLIIRGAVQRINDIANTLLNKEFEYSSNTKVLGLTPDRCTLQRDVLRKSDPIMLSTLIDSVISEKRTQYRENMLLSISSDLEQGYGLFSNIDSIELGRVLSNIINNSVEAFDHNVDNEKFISVRLTASKTISASDNKNEKCNLGFVSISIVDNGKGIPQKILGRLGLEEGLSVGKNHLSSGSGHGLGLYHAFQFIKSSGGFIEISSEINRGTEINIFLPKASPPSWFVEHLMSRDGEVFVSVDDDQSIHQIWKSHFKRFNGIKHIAFTSIESFREHFRAELWHIENITFLIDYEFLGQKANGVQIIQELSLAPKSILVTSRFDEVHVQQKINELNLRVIPKCLAPFVPIKSSHC